MGRALNKPYVCDLVLIQGRTERIASVLQAPGGQAVQHGRFAASWPALFWPFT